MSSTGKPAGWTILRAIGMGIAVLGMVGFGLCSAFGLLFSLGGGFVIGFVLVGAGITYLFYLLFRHISNLVDGDYEDRSS